MIITVWIAAVTVASRPAASDWPLDGRALCTAAGTQGYPTVVADGAGGAIVAWHDYRSGTNYDIYAQHVLASGMVDAAWPVDGLALCTAAGPQEYPRVAGDGAGGAIVAWEEYRSGDADIYAQHVLASGAVDAAWPVDGSALCTAPAAQYGPTIVADGAGGAIVTWYDGRGGNADIYAQRVLASGAVDAAWPVDGRALCTAPGFQELPVIAGDGVGGAIVAWQDGRSDPSGTLSAAKTFVHDIYAQRVLASGAVDAAWPVDGRALRTAPTAQRPTIVADGAGGAIVAWSDFRSGFTSEIYAQHVLASGAVDGAWPADGRALSIDIYSQYGPSIAPDQAGGAIVAWQDGRNGAKDDIYAQHVSASGAVDDAWPVDGRPLCTADNEQFQQAIVTDGAGGAIVAWTDYRTAIEYDIYAQHVLASGVVDVAWPVDGYPLCAAPGFQELPVIAGDEAGAAIVAWQDSRSGSADIYAQRVPASGAVSVPGGGLANELALVPPSPNPARSVVTLRFALSSPGPVSLAIFDEGGRRVRTVADGYEPMGEQTFTWDLHDGAGHKVQNGLFFVRLKVAGRVFGRKLVVAR